MNKWRNWDSKFNWLCKQQCTSLKDWLGYHWNFSKEEIESVRHIKMVKFQVAK